MSIAAICNINSYFHNFLILTTQILIKHFNLSRLQAVSEDDPNRYPLHLGPGGGSAPQDHTWQRPGHHLQGGHHPHHLAQHHQARPLAEHTGTNAQPKPWSLTQKELEVSCHLSAR